MNTFPDYLIVRYRRAWRELWKSEPPIIRKAGTACVVIVTDRGQSGYINQRNFAARINDMMTWSEEA